MEEDFRPVTFTALIYEICALAPSSIAHAFSLPDTHPGYLFFFIKLKDLYQVENPNDYRSRAECWKVHMKSGHNEITDVLIKNNETVTPIPMGEFANSIITLLKKLIFQPNTYKVVKSFETHGFTENTKKIEWGKVPGLPNGSPKKFQGTIRTLPNDAPDKTEES